MKRRVTVRLSPYAYHELQQQLMAAGVQVNPPYGGPIDIDNVTVTKPDPPRNDWIAPKPKDPYE